LIEPFIIWQKRAFVIFKIAQTSNGRIGGGYPKLKGVFKPQSFIRFRSKAPPWVGFIWVGNTG